MKRKRFSVEQIIAAVKQNELVTSALSFKTSSVAMLPPLLISHCAVVMMEIMLKNPVRFRPAIRRSLIRPYPVSFQLSPQLLRYALTVAFLPVGKASLLHSAPLRLRCPHTEVVSRQQTLIIPVAGCVIHMDTGTATETQ